MSIENKKKYVVAVEQSVISYYEVEVGAEEIKDFGLEVCEDGSWYYDDYAGDDWVFEIGKECAEDYVLDGADFVVSEVK